MILTTKLEAANEIQISTLRNGSSIIKTLQLSKLKNESKYNKEKIEWKMCDYWTMSLCNKLCENEQENKTREQHPCLGAHWLHLKVGQHEHSDAWPRAYEIASTPGSVRHRAGPLWSLLWQATEKT